MPLYRGIAVIVEINIRALALWLEPFFYTHDASFLDLHHVHLACIYTFLLVHRLNITRLILFIGLLI
ncbi:hypothetical protein ViNHUV68_40280 [Vibrio sp. NH-UV-68]